MSVHKVTTLPTAELTARIALACAGLNGHRTIGACLTNTTTAHELVADIRSGTSSLPPKLQHRIRRMGTPTVVAGVLDATRQLGLRILTPTDPDWPAQLAALGLATPQLLWVAGDTEVLREAPVGVTGVLRPEGPLVHAVLDLVTQIAGDEWLVATTRRPGVDQYVRRATRAMHGQLVTLAGVAATSRDGEVVLSENPPGLPVVLGTALRTPILLAALSGKVLVAGDQLGSPGTRTGAAAHALGRPLGVIGGQERAGGNRLRTRYHARTVRTLGEVERLT